MSRVFWEVTSSPSTWQEPSGRCWCEHTGSPAAALGLGQSLSLSAAGSKEISTPFLLLFPFLLLVLLPLLLPLPPHPLLGKGLKTEPPNDLHPAELLLSHAGAPGSLLQVPSSAHGFLGRHLSSLLGSLQFEQELEYPKGSVIGAGVGPVAKQECPDPTPQELPVGPVNSIHTPWPSEQE